MIKNINMLILILFNATVFLLSFDHNKAVTYSYLYGVLEIEERVLCIKRH
jgi:hypothetical protein